MTKRSEKIEAKIEKLKAQKNLIEKRERRARLKSTRKQDTRLKILAGASIKKMIEDGRITSKGKEQMIDMIKKGLAPADLDYFEKYNDWKLDPKKQAEREARHEYLKKQIVKTKAEREELLRRKSNK